MPPRAHLPASPSGHHVFPWGCPRPQAPASLVAAKCRRHRHLPGCPHRALRSRVLMSLSTPARPWAPCGRGRVLLCSPRGSPGPSAGTDGHRGCSHVRPLRTPGLSSPRRRSVGGALTACAVLEAAHGDGPSARVPRTWQGDGHTARWVQHTGRAPSGSVETEVTRAFAELRGAGLPARGCRHTPGPPEDRSLAGPVEDGCPVGL